MFGKLTGRLHWSPHSSALSLQDPLSPDASVGLDPTSTRWIASLVARAATHSSPKEGKVFTLIDTLTMSVTLFMAIKPPTAVFFGGQEGGMQRALLCSYDWTTATFHKETVLRLETEVLSCMKRCGRIKLGLGRPFEELFDKNGNEVGTH